MRATRMLPLLPVVNRRTVPALWLKIETAPKVSAPCIEKRSTSPVTLTMLWVGVAPKRR